MARQQIIVRLAILLVAASLTACTSLQDQGGSAAAGRETLTGLAVQLPGTRVLEGVFHREGVAVGVPKNRPASLAYVTEFIETAKASGAVRRALDDAGFKDAMVAPASGQ